MAIVAVFGLLALFSIVSILLSTEDPRSIEPRDHPLLMATFVRR